MTDIDIFGEWAQTVSEATGLQPWVWMIVLILFLSLILDFAQRWLMKRLGSVLSKKENAWDGTLLLATSKPLSLLIWVIGITAVVLVIPVRDDGGLFSADLISRLRQVGVLIAVTWFLLAFIIRLENKFIETARHKGKAVDPGTIHTLGRIVRIFVVIVAVMVGLDTLGVNISGLMAAGGIGGLAVGFASKDLLANFFGGFTVFIERPFEIGDWIVIEESGIEGTVEEMGWRHTTIRTFDKRPVYVPNATFTTASVENPSRMTHRRINETIGIRYDDVDQMDAITGAVREMLKSHAEIDQSQTLMVHFTRFGSSSLDFFIYCMTRTVNWQKFHEVKQDVLLKTSRIILEHGARIAYPTQSIDMNSAPELAGLQRNDKPGNTPSGQS